MTISRSERHQIENEMIFRRSNEKVADELSALDAKHIEDGNIDLINDEDLELQFKCECSDENCTVRIPMKVTEYEEIHKDRDTFIVVPNHQVDLIEEVLKKTSNYTVVKKNHSIAEPSNSLNKTEIQNS